MVAAHLGDLEGAGRCGLRGVYVWREGEEEEEEEEDGEDGSGGAAGEKKGGRKEGRGVDIWIGVGDGGKEGGFLELARRLGEGAWVGVGV